MAIDILDEHEQGEVVRKWLRQYGGALFGGVLVGVAALVGIQQWQQHVVEQRAGVAQQFFALTEALDARDGDLADRLADEIRRSGARTPYAAFASFRQADAAVEAGQLDRAAEALEWVVANGKEAALQDLARLRLARVRLGQGDAEAAIAGVDRIAGATYAALASEVRGDALLALGRSAEAAAAYRAALEGDGAQFARAEVLRIKLDSLGVAGSADAGS